MPIVRTITPCLWFDGQAEEAARSRSVATARPRSMTTGTDDYWDKLGDGGDAAARQCGWPKDRFGLSWQVVPRSMGTLMTSTVPGAGERLMSAMLKMQKRDLAALEAAAAP